MVSETSMLVGHDPFGRSFLLPMMFVCLLALSCSAHPKAGTGDVAFRLLWEGQSDLDLIVVDPSGQCLSFLYRQSDNGGLLDVDCNGGTGMMCEKPIENVYWPIATAPSGPYVYWVEAPSLIPAEAPLEFEIQLLRGRDVVWRQGSEMMSHQQIFGPMIYVFPSLLGPRALEPGLELPECAGPFPTLGKEDLLGYESDPR